MDILGYIAIPFGYVMRFCVWVMQNNYLLALFLFALIVKIVLFPFGIKQQKNMIKQAHFKPREQAIRAKYAGRTDQKTQQQMQNEIMELYRSEGHSPLSGCLPLLIQFPVLIGLYRVVYSPLQYLLGMSTDLINNIINFATESGFALGNGNTASLQIVSVMRDNFSLFQEKFGNEANFPASADVLPNFNFLGVDLSAVPSLQNPSWLLIIPVLTFLAMFLSMKLTRRWTYQPNQGGANAGCSNNIMDFTMPLISVWMTFVFPAMLGIYWIFQSVLGVLQQFILSKMFPLPVFTEEDYKEAARLMKGKPSKAVKKATGTGGGKKPYNPNSLHHIDDDDYDENGNYIGDPTGKSYEEQAEEEVQETPTEEKPTSISSGELKDESDYGKKRSRKKGKYKNKHKDTDMYD